MNNFLVELYPTCGYSNLNSLKFNKMVNVIPHLHQPYCQMLHVARGYCIGQCRLVWIRENFHHQRKFCWTVPDLRYYGIRRGCIYDLALQEPNLYQTLGVSYLPSLRHPLLISHTSSQAVYTNNQAFMLHSLSISLSCPLACSCPCSTLPVPRKQAPEKTFHQL